MILRSQKTFACTEEATHFRYLSVLPTMMMHGCSTTVHLRGL
jgi:hypothetical protein